MSLTNAPNLLRSLTAEPLVIEGRTLQAFVSVLRRRALDGASFTGQDLHAEMDVPQPREPERARGRSTVQVVPIIGAIANRAMSMGTGALRTAALINAAAADRRVDAIVLDIDSPGGTVMGVPELAAAIFRARQQKPVKAVARGLMASAAYWSGSAADEVALTPSSEAGSIGVIAVHEDWSQWLENEGIAMTEFAAGKYKTEGAPWKPLDDEGVARFDERVGQVYDWFVRDVARFRGVPEATVRGPEFGEGRVLSAEEAVASGMADRIVGSIDEVVAELTESDSPRRGARADADANLERRKRARLRG